MDHRGESPICYFLSFINPMIVIVHTYYCQVYSPPIGQWKVGCIHAQSCLNIRSKILRSDVILMVFSFLIRFRNSIMSIWKEKHCLQPIPMYIAKFYIIRKRGAKSCIAHFKCIVIKDIDKWIQISIVRTDNTSSIRKLKSIVRR